MRLVLPSALLASVLLAGPASAQVWGDTARFGRGITSVGDHGRLMHFDLRSPAYGVLVRLAPGQPVRVVDVRDYAPGPSELRVPLVMSDDASRKTYRSGGVSATGADAADASTRAMRDQSNCIQAVDPNRHTTPTAGAPSNVNLAAVCASTVPQYEPSRATTVQRAAEYQHDYLLFVVSEAAVDSVTLARVHASAPTLDSLARALAPQLAPANAAWAAYMVRR